MTNENVRLYPHDRFLDKIGIRFIPVWIRPNQITVLRFCMIPFVLWTIWRQSWMWSLALFLAAALTDAIDGTLARLRRQITVWGTIADPLADKLLIGSVLVIFVARILQPWVAVIILGLEALIVGAAYVRHRRGVMSSANASGKAKMLFQVASIALLLGAQTFHWPFAIPLAAAALALAIMFATISLLTYGL